MGDSSFLRCTECRALNEPRALFCGRCGAALYGRTPEGGWRKRRRFTAAGALMGFACLLVLLATAFVGYVVVSHAMGGSPSLDPLAGQVGTTATTVASISTGTTGGSTSDSTTSTTTGSPVIRPTSVSASSTLKATSTNSYRPTNLVDGDLATAWNEGADGTGTGEWVLFKFSQSVTLSRIEIANGYQKDEDRFNGNPRVKSMKIEYSDGNIQLVTLLDTESYQSIKPTKQSIEWFKFVIVSTYPGSAWEDTALSEVRIYQGASESTD